MVSKRVIFERFYSLCSLFCYILRAFSIKQLFHSRSLDMRLVIANSHPTRTHGIIVKCNSVPSFELLRCMLLLALGGFVTKLVKAWLKMGPHVTITFRMTMIMITRSWRKGLYSNLPVNKFTL